MGIYLRTHTDKTNGDVVDYAWYCSHTCYQDSFEHSPVSDVFELGGAYPCGAESDSADYCDTCGDPVGNPLTEEGERYVLAFVRDVETLDGFDTRGRQRRIELAAALRQEYGYLWHPITGEGIHDIEPA